MALRSCCAARLRTSCATRFGTRLKGTAVEVALQRQNGGGDRFAVISVAIAARRSRRGARKDLSSVLPRGGCARSAEWWWHGIGSRNHRTRGAHARRICSRLRMPRGRACQLRCALEALNPRFIRVNPRPASSFLRANCISTNLTTRSKSTLPRTPRSRPSCSAPQIDPRQSNQQKHRDCSRSISPSAHVSI